MQKVLITGSSGFTGQYVIDYFSGINDILITGADSIFEHKQSQYKNIKIDLLQPDQVFKVIKSESPDYIIHLAGINKSNDYRDFYRLNVFTTANLLEAVLKYNLQKTRMLFISSSAVYGKSNETEVNEQSVTKPVNYYGISKLAMENLVLQYYYNYNLDIKIVRTFNLIGPGQDLSFVIPHFIHQVLKIKSNLTPPIMHTGNLSSSRDFINVRDAVDGYWKILTQGKPGEIYNLAGNKSYKIELILDKIIELAGIRMQVKIDAKGPSPLDIPILIGNTNKLNKLGWKPKIFLEESLREMIKFAGKEFV